MLGHWARKPMEWSPDPARVRTRTSPARHTNHLLIRKASLRGTGLGSLQVDAQPIFGGPRPCGRCSGHAGWLAWRPGGTYCRVTAARVLARLVSSRCLLTRTLPCVRRSKPSRPQRRVLSCLSRGDCAQCACVQWRGSCWHNTARQPPTAQHQPQAVQPGPCHNRPLRHASTAQPPAAPPPVLQAQAQRPRRMHATRRRRARVMPLLRLHGRRWRQQRQTAQRRRPWSRRRRPRQPGPRAHRGYAHPPTLGCQPCDRRVNRVPRRPQVLTRRMVTVMRTRWRARRSQGAAATKPGARAEGSLTPRTALRCLLPRPPPPPRARHGRAWLWLHEGCGHAPARVRTAQCQCRCCTRHATACRSCVAATTVAGSGRAMLVLVPPQTPNVHGARTPSLEVPTTPRCA